MMSLFSHSFLYFYLILLSIFFYLHMYIILGWVGGWWCVGGWVRGRVVVGGWVRGRVVVCSLLVVGSEGGGWVGRRKVDGWVGRKGGWWEGGRSVDGWVEAGVTDTHRLNYCLLVHGA